MEKLSCEPEFIQALGQFTEQIAFLKSFLIRLLQTPKVNEELLGFGLSILKKITIPEVATILTKFQILELLLGFLVRKVLSPNSIVIVLHVNLLKKFVLNLVFEPTSKRKFR